MLGLEPLGGRQIVCTLVLILAGDFSLIRAISFTNVLLEYLGCGMILSTPIILEIKFHYGVSQNHRILL